MAKKRIVSKPGLFGITYHYENGRYIGKTRLGLLGNRKIHYDAVILERERWWKNILLTRTFGYNDN